MCFTEKMSNQLKYIKLFNHFHAEELQLQKHKDIFTCFIGTDYFTHIGEHIETEMPSLTILGSMN